MSNVELTAEDLEKNFNKMRALCEKLGDRSVAALALVDGLGERLALCPASARKDYHGSYPGGLVEHTLHVLTNAMALTKGFGWTIPKDSLIISALFHDIGKVGDVNVDYYVPAEDWLLKKGELYSYNKNIQYMTVPLRSIFLCQHYGLKLTQDEMLAIYLHDGFAVDDNKQYCLKDTLLAHVIMQADYIATMTEKGKFEQ
jgi:hypothetical protein